MTNREFYTAISEGKLTDEIKEFAAWAGLTPIKKVPYADYLQVIG